MKLSVNEAKLIGLWAGNCATIQQFFILKFEICLRVRKFTGPSEKRVPEKALKRFTVYCTKWKNTRHSKFSPA